MKTRIEEIIAATAVSPEAAKVCSERVLAIIRDVTERLKEKYKVESVPLGRSMKKSYILGGLNAMCDMRDLADGKWNIKLEQLPLKDKIVFRGWLNREPENILCLNVAEKDWDGDPYIMLPRRLFLGCTKEHTMNVKVTIEEV